MNETTWNIYNSNPESWRAMLEACEAARESIDLENFIFMPDEIGNRFIEVCAKRAAKGVKVRFIWDAAGSFSFFGFSIIEELKQKGIELIFFKTLLPGIFNIHKYRSWYFRDHRRTLVIDKKVGFTGSICISKRMEDWRDTHVRVVGPVVEDMQNEFEGMWLRAQGIKHRKIHRIIRMLRTKVVKSKKANEFQYITNTPFPKNRHLYREIVEAIRNARKYIYITTPYFVPTLRLARALRVAARRGVDVKIILPVRSDYPIVDLGARTFFHNLLRAGVEIYLYKERIVHGKTMVIDGDWATVGSTNLDHVSLLYNFEANLVTTNKSFAEELVSNFNNDLKATTRLTLDEWNKRFFGEKIATFFIKFFRGFL